MSWANRTLGIGDVLGRRFHPSVLVYNALLLALILSECFGVVFPHRTLVWTLSEVAFFYCAAFICHPEPLLHQFSSLTASDLLLRPFSSLREKNFHPLGRGHGTLFLCDKCTFCKEWNMMQK